MWLVVRNQDTQVTRATEAEIAWLDNYLGFPDPKARFRRGGEGRRPMLNVITLTFPTGLLPLVQGEAKRQGIAVEVQRDERVVPCALDTRADISWLFDYQDEAIEHAVEKKRGIFWCPTGSGKGEVIVALALVFPCTWGVFVSSKSLLKEIADRYESRTGEDAGVIGDGTWRPRRFTVATFQTIYHGLCSGDRKVIAWLESLGAIDVDECHTLPADSFWQVAMACKNAYYRFGNSATPFARGDRKGLLSVAALGPTIYRIEQKTLVGEGAIARGKVHLVKHALDSALAAQLSEDRARFDEAYAELVVQNADRNAVVLGVVRAAAKPAFLFVRAIEHGKALERALNAAGVPAEFVWGEKHVKVREAAVRRLEHGDVDVIVCNVVFQAGVNVPSLASIVNAAGGKSHIAALQQTGRGSRRIDRAGHVVKDEFNVYDISDVNCGCKRKGPSGKARWLHKACEWMERHARSRRRAYLNEGYPVIDG